MHRSCKRLCGGFQLRKLDPFDHAVALAILPAHRDLTRALAPTQHQQAEGAGGKRTASPQDRLSDQLPSRPRFAAAAGLAPEAISATILAYARTRGGDVGDTPTCGHDDWWAVGPRGCISQRCGLDPSPRTASISAKSEADEIPATCHGRLWGRPRGCCGGSRPLESSGCDYQ